MKIGIFGSSGFAREALDIAIAMNFVPYLILKDDEYKVSPTKYNTIYEKDLIENDFDGFAIGVGSNDIRKKISEKYKHLNWINLIHPSVTFGYDMENIIPNSKGLIFCAGTRLTNSIKFGNFVILNLNSTIGHDCIIESYVNLSPGAHVSGNVHIGDCTWLGTNCSVNNGYPDEKLIIPDNTIIGSGAVVTKTLSKQGIYVGAPARILKK